MRTAIDVVDPADRISHAYLHERLGRYLWMAADGQGSMAAYEQAVALLPEGGGPTRWRAAVLSGYSQILMLAGRYEESARLAREAIEVARKALGARSIEGHARNNLGVDLACLGRLDDGVAELLLARQIAEEEQDDSDDVARAIVNLAAVYRSRGRMAEAAEVAPEGIAVSERLGIERRKGVWCRCDAAEALIALGRYDEARQLLEDAAALVPLGVDALRTDYLTGHLTDPRRATSTPPPSTSSAPATTGTTCSTTSWWLRCTRASSRSHLGAATSTRPGKAALEAADRLPATPIRSSRSPCSPPPSPLETERALRAAAGTARSAVRSRGSSRFAASRASERRGELLLRGAEAAGPVRGRPRHR